MLAGEIVAGKEAVEFISTLNSYLEPVEKNWDILRCTFDSFHVELAGI